MDVVGFLVVVEVNDRDIMDFGMENIEETIQDILDDSHNFLVNLVVKIGFGVEMDKFPKEKVCSIYFEMDVHKPEIVN